MAGTRSDIHDAERKLTGDDGGEECRISLGEMCFDHEAERARHHNAGNKAGAPRGQEGGTERRGEQDGYGCREC